MTAEKLDPLLGQHLRGKWRLDSILGRGGMGVVYAATHRNGSRGAIKILHPHLAANESLRSRFVREGRAANAVGHEGVVQILDDDVTDEGVAFVVMELLEGETWKQRWISHDKRLDVRDVLTTALAVLEVLEAAHCKGVVHRDVKPDNVFLTTDGRVKLLDFGIARLRETSTEQTETGAMLGTPAYMSPEQALARWSEVDETSDLFALGATLWTLTSGRPVHDCATGPEMLVAAATRRAEPFRSICPGATTELSLVIDRALAFDRSGRWRSAREMYDAVAKALETLPVDFDLREVPASAAQMVTADKTLVSGSPARVDPHETARTSAKRSILLPMLGGAALAIAAGALSLLALREPPAPTSAMAQAMASNSAVVVPTPTPSAESIITSAEPEPPSIASADVTTPLRNGPVRTGPAPRADCVCNGPRSRLCKAIEHIDCFCNGDAIINKAPWPSTPKFIFPAADGVAAYRYKGCSGFTARNEAKSGTFMCSATCTKHDLFTGRDRDACTGFDSNGIAAKGKLTCPVQK